MASILDDLSESEFLISEPVNILFVVTVLMKSEHAKLRAKLTLILSSPVDKSILLRWKQLSATFKYRGSLTEGSCESCFCRLRHCCLSSLPCYSATDYCTCCIVSRNELAALIQAQL